MLSGSARPGAQCEVPEHHAGSRLGPEKGRFRRHPVTSLGRPGDLAYRGWPAQDGGVGPAGADLGQRPGRVVLVDQRVGWEPVQRGVDPARVELISGIGSSGARPRQPVPAGSGYSHGALAGHLGQQRGGITASRCELETVRQKPEEVELGRHTGHQPVDGQDLEVGFGQLDDEGQERVVTSKAFCRALDLSGQNFLSGQNCLSGQNWW